MLNLQQKYQKNACSPHRMALKNFSGTGIFACASIDAVVRQFAQAKMPVPLNV